MEQRDELEIETRLRAALNARSELVTHSTLRPGIPPNEHTAGVRAKQAGLWSWRRFLVPATVAAALVGGVFVGAQLPGDKDGKDKNPIAAGNGGTASPTGAQATQPSVQGVPQPAVTEPVVGTLKFTLAAGWQVTTIDATSACVSPKSGANSPGAAGTPAASGSSGSAGATGTAAAKPAAGLPCGLDALYLKSDAAADAWPRSTAAKAAGWWPQPVAAATAIVCPSAKPDAGDHVATSVLLRSSAQYKLGAGAEAGAQTTAAYHEWAVTCDEGFGVRPMLWELQPAAGSAGTDAPVVTAVSSDPATDAALLGMVGSLHLAG